MIFFSEADFVMLRYDPLKKNPVQNLKSVGGNYRSVIGGGGGNFKFGTGIFLRLS